MGRDLPESQLKSNPLLNAPSTVSNNPVHGARLRGRAVASAIANQCSTLNNRGSSCLLRLMRLTLS